MAEPLLEVNDLKVRFATEDGIVQAVDGVSFKLERGKVLGIVGESGSGKSVTAMTLMGLTRGVNAAFEGEVLYKGTDLLKVSDNGMQDYRGNELGMIFQDPMTSLNPVYRIGEQIAEAIRSHEKVDKRTARARTIELLRQVGIPNPESRIDSFPHEFSGGMRQRAMIAMALSCNPSVLIADEPTTALDVTIQAQIVDLVNRLKDDFDSAVIFITHDLGVIAEIADEVIVMYAGRVVEQGSKRDIFYDPQMPYTWGLLGSIPRLDRPRVERLHTIEGSPPSLINAPGRLQVPAALPACVREVQGGAGSREPCRDSGPSRPLLARPRVQARPSRRDDFRRHGRGRVTALEQSNGSGERPLLEVRHVKKYFPIRAGVLQREYAHVHAVDDVSFAVEPGETLGLVGESGCGKSTLGRTIVRLLEPTAGEIIFDGTPISEARRRGGCGRFGARCRWSFRIRTRRSTLASASGRSCPIRCGSTISAAARSRSRGSTRSSRRSASRPSTTTASRTSSPAGSASGSASRARSRCGRS